MARSEFGIIPYDTPPSTHTHTHPNTLTPNTHTLTHTHTHPHTHTHTSHHSLVWTPPPVLVRFSSSPSPPAFAAPLPVWETTTGQPGQAHTVVNTAH